MAFLVITDSAFAHNRRYVFSQEYRTIPQGGWEIESHTRLKVPNWNTSNKNTWEFHEELEYGITDRWTLAGYLVWRRNNRIGSNDSTVFKGTKLETKYRIGKKGQYWLDPLLYLEWVRNERDRSNESKVEAKLVLSKDFNKVNLTYNQIIESTLGDGGRTEHNFSFGANYELPHDFFAGLETKGNYWRPGNHRNKLSMGPTVAWEGTYFWVTTGVLFGLNRAANDIEARVIVGIPIG